MCGIAGYYNLTRDQFPYDKIWLEKMQQMLAHRGPDGYRIWASPEQGIALVHRRLSIVDVSQAAYQPFFNKDGSIAVICNGEIYNHQKIRAELEARGYVYHSHSDSETIVYAYEEWGISCIEKFEGMFAIALFDMRTQECYLVRDRIGVKPLYFSVHGNMLNFASEIKALWCLPWVEKKVHAQSLYHYLTYMATPAPYTLYEGVYKLPAGYYAKVDAQKNLAFHEWYCPTTKHMDWGTGDESYWIEHIRTQLTASIEKRMMSDVPFGVFLSGGIDSSLNVAIMSQLTDRVKTFSVSFSDGPECNELAWARKVARHFNTDHYEIEINEQDAFSFFERMVHFQDEPLGDCVCIPLYYVSQLAKDTGVTVVQVGEGSDELFCGYSSYADYLDVYHRYWKPSQSFIPSFARKSAYYLAAQMLPASSMKRSLLHDWADGNHLFWTGARAFTEEWKQEIYTHAHTAYHDPIADKIYPGLVSSYASYDIVDYHLRRLKSRMPHADFLTSMIYLELKHRLPELLLMRVDKMTMATGVEARVPFLDYKFVDMALQIPSALKYKDGVTKYILKRAAEGLLPNDIIYRKKMGFAAPTTRWFKTGNYFRTYFDDMLASTEQSWGTYLNFDQVRRMRAQHEAGTHDFSVQLWVLQNVLACEL